MVLALHANLISCRFDFLLILVASTRATPVICSVLLFVLEIVIMSSVDSGWRVFDRFPWKSQSEFCVVRAMHKFTSLGFVCSPTFFSLHAASCLSRVGWFLRALAFRLLYYPWGKMGTTRSLMQFWCCPGVGHLHTFLCPTMGFWRNCLPFHGGFVAFPKERQMPGGGEMGMLGID